MQDSEWLSALQAWRDGDIASADSALERLLLSHPDQMPAHHLLGCVKTELGDLEAAQRHLRIVCAAEPANDMALSALGHAQHLAGQLNEAAMTLHSGLAINPDNPILQFNLGCVLRDSQISGPAEAAFLRACELDPADQAAWFNLGLIRYERANPGGAAQAFVKAMELDGPDSAAAARLAGFAFADAGLPMRAEPLLSGLCPKNLAEAEDFDVLTELLYCRLELCDWRGHAELLERCKRFVAEGRAPLEPFTFLLPEGIGPMEQLALTSAYASRFIPVPRPRRQELSDPDPGRRIRIAYLSSDFHDHPVARLIAGMLEQHDRMGFEIHAFSYGGPDTSAWRKRIVAACDKFHDVSGYSIAALDAAIRAESIDILVDLTGWSGHTKTAVLALRPAPIQINWLGYSGTLGSGELADYLIGDPISTPFSHQDRFAESLALLPRFCQPNDTRRQIGQDRRRADVGLPDDALVLCCLGRPLKITPQMFGCWCDLLVEIPGSVLWLLDSNETAKANLVAVATERGIAPSRLIFFGRCPPDEYLARLQLADLILDTYPFGAHTTASDALYVGVPVLTRIGETFASRVTASLLHAAGLEQLVTTSLDEYRRCVLDLCADSARNLRDIRTGWECRRSSSSLFDAGLFAAEFESLLRSIWTRHCRGELPGRR